MVVPFLGLPFRLQCSSVPKYKPQRGTRREPIGKGSFKV